MDFDISWGGKNNMQDAIVKGMVAINFKKIFRRKTAVFIDYANVKAWAKRHNYLLNLQVLYSYLIKRGISKVSLYYGNDPKNPSSLSFLNKLRTFGYEIITKEVKYIRVSLLDLFKKPVNRQLLNKLSAKIKSFLLKEVEELERKNIRLLSPKANFDVEITLDIILFSDQYDVFVLFSGDSDFIATVKYLRSLEKKVVVISDKKFLAGELYQNSDLTVFFHDLIKEIPNFAIKNPGRTGEKL